jgi:hypothetical protein
MLLNLDAIPNASTVPEKFSPGRNALAHQQSASASLLYQSTQRLTQQYVAATTSTKPMDCLRPQERRPLMAHGQNPLAVAPGLGTIPFVNRQPRW